MNIGDVYGGSVQRHSSTDGGATGGLVNVFTVVPDAPFSAAAGFVVTSYEISQLTTGTGVYVLFYDATAAPAAGTAWFGNATASENVVWACEITAGGSLRYNVGPAGHRYVNGCTIVISAGVDTTQLQLANAKSLICVHGFPLTVD